MGRKKRIAKGHENDRFLHYPDCGDGFMRVRIRMSKFINWYTLTCSLLFFNHISLNFFNGIWLNRQSLFKQVQANKS